MSCISPQMSQRASTDLMLDSFDAPHQSQSQDCEPSPPIPRHGSKTNFFSPQDSRAYLMQSNKPPPWSPYGPPTPRATNRVPLSSEQVQQDGFPSWTFVNSPRSVRTTPPRSLTSPVVTAADSYNNRTQRQSPGSPASSLTPGQSPAAAKRSSARKNPPTSSHHAGGRNTGRPRNMSPQRKFASESELARALAADKANGNYEARANQTADNIQELADWDEAAAHRFQRDRSGAYRSSRRTSGASPQGGRRASEQLLVKTPPDASPVKMHAAMRPVSFVKALELTAEQTSYGGNARKTDPLRQLAKVAQSSSEQEDRKSLYEMNYEISV